MITTAEILQERIKELTCLYEVSSVIVNTNLEQFGESLQAISISLKRAFQFPEYTHISIVTALGNFQTSVISKDLSINATIHVFNNASGSITASLSNPISSFLHEEQQLLDSVASKIGNLVERIEIQRNEASLKRQMERADRLSILGELTAGIAHELNTPLCNILGYAELLKDNLTGHPEAVQDIDKIIQNAIFSREVVKKLMFFACEMPQSMKYIDIISNIKNAIDLLEPTFRKARVVYKINIPGNELFLKADSVQFTQIIFNLLTNAIYFSPVDGAVTVSAFQKNKHLYLTVADEGTGIPASATDKLFQPFFTTKSTGQGSGLGLSVVHGIVTSHKGTITAANNKDKGATFTIKFPLTT